MNRISKWTGALVAAAALAACEGEFEQAGEGDGGTPTHEETRPMDIEVRHDTQIVASARRDTAPAADGAGEN